MPTAQHLAPPTESEITACVVRALVKLAVLAFALIFGAYVVVFGASVLVALVCTIVGFAGLLALIAAGMDPAPAPKAKTYKLL